MKEKTFFLLNYFMYFCCEGIHNLMITPCKVHPSEAQLATLPHYLHPGLPMETSEVRAQFRNPFQVIKGTTDVISGN